MHVCRFTLGDGRTRAGLVTDGSSIMDLTPAGVTSLTPLLEGDDPARAVAALASDRLPRIPLAAATLLAPVERQEVWAAGVTYLRSKTSRMEDSDFGATAYDRVYFAERPEIFFKSLAEKVSGPHGPVGIRSDSEWNVPEPELAIVFNSKGAIVGYTIGNDMSSRDIEATNLLYLTQAKLYSRSCALGPWITLGIAEKTARRWAVAIEILRGGQRVFTGETTVNKIRRRFSELAEFLFRSQEFPHGAVLLTGTGVVVPEDFTLQAHDVINIDISGIGRLQNVVTVI